MMFYYCENCCTIHVEQHICHECGSLRLHPIIIDVQYHKNEVRSPKEE